MTDDKTDTGTTEEKELSIATVLVNSEGEQVTLRFEGPISVPTTPYDGDSYGTDTLEETTVRATVKRAEFEGVGRTLRCVAEISSDEVSRLGINPDALAGAEGSGVAIEIVATREAGDTSPDEDDSAVAAESFDSHTPWSGLPTAYVGVNRAEGSNSGTVESDNPTQFDPPVHEIGTVSDVERSE